MLRLSPAYYSIVLIHTYIFLWRETSPWFNTKAVYTMCENTLPYHLSYTLNLALAWMGLGQLHVSVTDY